jgi:hypothetical protein
MDIVVEPIKNELKHWVDVFEHDHKGFLRLEKGDIVFSENPAPKGFFETLKRLFGFGDWSLQQITATIQKKVKKLDVADIQDIQHAVDVFNKEVVDKANRGILRNILPLARIHHVVLPHIIVVHLKGLKESVPEKLPAAPFIFPAPQEKPSLISLQPVLQEKDQPLPMKKNEIFKRLDAWYAEVEDFLWFYEKPFLKKVLSKLRTKIEGSSSDEELQKVLQKFREKVEENIRLNKNMPSNDHAKEKLRNVPSVIENFLTSYF